MIVKSIYVDAVHFSVRDNYTIKKLAPYVILELNEYGKKDVLTIQVRQSESSKY